jgi:hypothetical protein
MRLLVGIMSAHFYDYYFDELTRDYIKTRCLDQQERVNTIRDTWLKELPEGVDYKFFYGTKFRVDKERRNPPPQPKLRDPLADEVYLDCGDYYTENPAKMQGICKYALDHGYDFLLRTDDDTFVYPDRLLKEDWAGFDYSGSSPVDFHPGGCMFLSRRAMEIVVAGRPDYYADDVWIGKVMKKSGIPMHHIESIHNEWGKGYSVDPAAVGTNHSALHSCTPSVMRMLYTRRNPAVRAAIM